MEGLIQLLQALQDLQDKALETKNQKITDLTQKIAEVWALYETALNDIKGLKAEDQAEDAGFLAQINQAAEGRASAEQALSDNQALKSADETRLSAILSEAIAKAKAADADSVEAAQPSEPATTPSQQVPLEPPTKTERF